MTRISYSNHAAQSALRAIPSGAKQVQDFRASQLRAPVKITASLADDPEYVPIRSTVTSSGMALYFLHADARRLLVKCGQVKR